MAATIMVNPGAYLSLSLSCKLCTGGGLLEHVPVTSWSTEQCTQQGTPGQKCRTLLQAGGHLLNRMLSNIGTCLECSCVCAVYAQMSTVFVEQVRAVLPLLVLALCACCVTSLQLSSSAEVHSAQNCCSLRALSNLCSGQQLRLVSPIPPPVCLEVSVAIAARYTIIP